MPTRRVFPSARSLAIVVRVSCLGRFADAGWRLGTRRLACFISVSVSAATASGSPLWGCRLGGLCHHAFLLLSAQAAHRINVAQPKMFPAHPWAWWNPASRRGGEGRMAKWDAKTCLAAPAIQPQVYDNTPSSKPSHAQGRSALRATRSHGPKRISDDVQARP